MRSIPRSFFFGYALTMVPLVRAGLALAVVLPLAFASDSFSIAVMELVDNGVMLAVPGATDAGLANPLFWGALALAFVVAFVVAFPVNKRLIARGRGHAVVHAYHGGDGHGAEAPQLGSPRRFVAMGVAAMAVTIGVATGGALLVESRGMDEPAQEPGMPAEHDG